jgi:hypothetical protein
VLIALIVYDSFKHPGIIDESESEEPIIHYELRESLDGTKYYMPMPKKKINKPLRQRDEKGRFIKSN